MKLDWLWCAEFCNGKTICQPEDDKYSKHDPNANWNPSAFRDFLDYFGDNKDKLVSFSLKNSNTGEEVSVCFDDNRPFISILPPDEGKEPSTVSFFGDNRVVEGLHNGQPIYYREMENVAVNGVFGKPRVVAYVVGYQGQDKDGKNYRKMVRILA